MTGYPTPVLDGATVNGPLSVGGLAALTGGGTLNGTFTGSPILSGAPQIPSGIFGGTGRYDLKLSGAAGNGTTDDTAKIQAFLNTLLPGSTAVVPPNTLYLINSADLTIPNGITIEGGNPFSGWGTTSGPFAGCGFYLNPAHIIILGEGCTLRGLKIYRSGLLTSPTAAQVNSAVSAWNSEVTFLTTSADTASGSTLPFASTTGVSVGQRVFGYNIANGTTVSAVTSTSVTLLTGR